MIHLFEKVERQGCEGYRRRVRAPGRSR